VRIGDTVPAMNAVLQREIAKLGVEARLQLIDELWSAIAAAEPSPRPTPEQRATLLARQDAFVADPERRSYTFGEILAALPRSP
jgi:putative addiction module component (TIGR02574 family)